MADAEEKHFVPFTATVSSRPLWISPQKNTWCDILCAKHADLVNRHYHPHELIADTICGKRGYLEHDWTTTAGDFVCERPPGEVCTLLAYEHPGPMRVLFTVQGPLIWLDEKGDSSGCIDVHHFIAMCREHDSGTDLGAGYVATVFC